MDARIELFPYCEPEGAPVLAVSIEEPPEHDEELAIQTIRNKRPMLRGLWIKDAPWGDLALDTALLKVMGSPQVGTLPIMTIRPIDSEHWSNLNIYQIADVSAWLSEPTSVDQLAEKIAALHLYPQVSEILMRETPRQNLNPMLLDQIYAHLNPPGIGFIYCPHADFGYRRIAANAVANCSTPWAVRFEPCQPSDHEETPT